MTLDRYGLEMLALRRGYTLIRLPALWAIVQHREVVFTAVVLRDIAAWLEKR